MSKVIWKENRDILIQKGSTLRIEMFKSTFNDLGDNPGKPLNNLFYSLSYFERITYLIIYLQNYGTHVLTEG